MGMGITYAIIRPTLVFGEGDLLLNNMAWALRRFPVLGLGNAPAAGLGSGRPGPAGRVAARDVVLTRDEVDGLMGLPTHQPE